MHACRDDLHQSNFGNHGGQHGQESEESKEGEENNEEEKEVTVRRKLHGIRIASEASCAFATRAGRSFRSQNIRVAVETGSLCRWLLHNGPGFLKLLPEQ